jgi:spore maturation protein CgeB
MKVVYFTHSLSSCWNHGNAHFLRGVLRELLHAGHEVAAHEPAQGWSLSNLLADHGPEGVAASRAAAPELEANSYGDGVDLDAALEGADLVIVHEWTDPTLVAAVGKRRACGAPFRLLFHDTHHRAVSDPGAIGAMNLDGYDGVLAFGRSLAEVYRKAGWGDRAYIWHEAADPRLFRPPAQEPDRRGLVWIGNWGDGERTAELEEYLFRPAAELGLPLTVHGVRYPAEALAMLERYGARYCGWLPNARVPQVFSGHLATVHVPRRFYVDALPGIPTIRVFEAMACGIPLVSAPWRDSENLFSPGQDFLFAADGAEVARHLRDLANDAAMRAELAAHARRTIEERHSCAIRMRELVDIAETLGVGQPAPQLEPAS